MRKYLALALLLLAVPAQGQQLGPVNPPYVQGPASATSGHIATFSGTTGKIVADGGVVPTSATTANVAAAVAVTGAVKSNGSTTFGQAACSDLSDGTTNCSAAVGQLPGTTTNDAAAAGKVGEYTSASVASGTPVSLTTSTQTTVITLPLNAGDYDVTGSLCFKEGAATVVSAQIVSVSAITNTNGALSASTNSVATGSSFDNCLGLPETRISLAAPGNAYAIGLAFFATDVLSAYGTITARRAR